VRPRASGGRVRTGLLILLVGSPLLTGCHSWRTSSLAPQALLAEQRPDMLRVTLRDGGTVTLSQPRLVADTIVGTSDAGTQRTPVEEVRTLEVRRTSFAKTVGLVVTHVGVVVTAIVLIIDAQPHYRGF
jgi:hypothetical protein